jgi:hypothetical protein
MGRMVGGLILIFVLIWFFPMTMDAIHGLQTNERTDADLAKSSSNVTLTHDLWQEDPDSVVTAVDDKGNVLTATTYVEATRVLTLSGWHAEAATADIVYEVDALTQFTGFGPAVAMSPLLIWLLFLGGAGWSVFSGFKSKFGS